MYIRLVTHGQFKEAMPKGHKRAQVVYADKIEEVLGYLLQFDEMRELLRFARYELRVGPTIKNSRSLHPDEMAKLTFSPGTTLHLCPAMGGNEITTAMLITALVSAAVSIAFSLAAMLFMPTNQEVKDQKKGTLYDNGLIIQQENAPLFYNAGIDVPCGGNLIEGAVVYMSSGGLGAGDQKPLQALVQQNMEGVAKLKQAMGIDTVDGAKGGGGGKVMGNSIVTDASLLALIAMGDGPIGGVIGDTREAKEKNIYINRQPLRDHGTGQLTYQGIIWDERSGEEGQSVVGLVPGIQSNLDGNVDLPRNLSGGGQFFHQVTLSNAKADKCRVRLMVKVLVDVDNKKGNQEPSTVQWGFNVKRLTSPTWTPAGTFSYRGKSSDPFVLERIINAPPATANENEQWQYQIYRITPDSGSDKIKNETAWNGHTEIQSIDLAYDGTDTCPPVALLGIGLDLAQFGQGGSYPEVMVRARGRKVRVPTNYDPITRVYTGVWDGAWKTAATQNPVWHWLHIATDKQQGLGYPDTYFNKFDLYEIAKFNDQNVNGRPRYTLNKQFRDQKDGWPFLVELATSFRAFPYYDGSRISLVQDRPNQPISHYVNNTMVEGGFFNYQNTDLSQQFNEVLVTYADPDDYFNEKTVRYQDPASIARNRAAGLAGNGIIRGKFDKVGCTNIQEAYDFARMIAYVAQNENETVEYETTLGAAAYRPGQFIEVDDIIVAHKQFTGRAFAAESTGIRLDVPWTQKANAIYHVHLVLDNQLVVRPIAMALEDRTTNLIPCDPSGVEYGTPLGIVEEGGAQPRVFRIENIEDIGGGKHKVTGKIHVEGKYEWIEQNVPVPAVPWSDLKRQSYIPAPNNPVVTHTYSYDELKGSRHNLSVSWDAINDPAYALRGYLVEVYKPDAQWHQLYEGMMNRAVVEDAGPGKYIFSIKPINTFGASGDAAVVEYELVYGQGEGSNLKPPVFVGFD